MANVTALEALDELYNNYIKLRLTSYYHDQNYQIATDKFLKAVLSVQATYPKTKFIANVRGEGMDYLDGSTVLQYGSMKCDEPGKEAFMDSWLSCALFRLPFLLENIQLGYICLALSFVILLISLFGGIKESYKWYILNQAIWDMLISYDFICEKPTLSNWHPKDWVEQNTCFYISNSSGSFLSYAGLIIQDLIKYAFFIPLLLLAFSRFLGLYAPMFVKKVFSKSAIRNIAFIILVDIFFIFLIAFRRLCRQILVPLSNMWQEECATKFCTEYNMNTTICWQNSTEYFQCKNNANMLWPIWLKRTFFIPFLTAPIMFLSAILFAALLFIKIVRQLKYQIKQNRTMFMSTVKIASVIVFQCVTMSIICCSTAFQSYFYYQANKYSQTVRLYIYDSIPPLLLLFQYPATIAAFNILRIFLDSFILLTVLNGYSLCLVGIIKWVYLCFKKPKRALHKLTSKFSKRNANLFVTVASANKVS